MKKIFLASLFLLLAGAVYGQTPVTVTGTIYAPNGALATSGYVQFTITPTSQSIQYYVQGVGVIAPQTSKCGINASGLVKNTALTGACTIWGNDVITPGNTLYTVVFAPANAVSNTVQRQSITGSSYNLNAPIFAPVVNIVPQYQTITTSPIAVNLVPVTDSVFNVGSSNRYYAAGYFRNLFADNCSGCGLSHVSDLPPLFTSSIVGSNLSFTLSNALANKVFGNCTGSTAAPTYCSLTNAMIPAPGSSTQLIYNTSGLFDASQDLTWDNTNKILGVRTSGSFLVRLLSDALGGKILFGTGTAPFIKDNTGAGWLFSSQPGQEIFFGPTNDPQAFIIGAAGSIPTGGTRLGVGSHFAFMQLNDGTSSAGVYKGAQIIMGSIATPEGTISAETGSLFLTTNGGAGATLWIKESSPTATTGWIAK